MVVLGLTAWLLSGCEQVDRPPRPDPSTFIANQVDTAVELLEDEEPEAPLTGGNNAPIVRQARIDPQKPKRSDDLIVLAETFDKDGDLLRTRFRWFINDKPLSGATGKRLTSGPYEKGDMVTVEVTVTDGPNDTLFETKGVRIQNSAPRMSQKGGGSGQLDGLKVDAVDPDGDELTFSLTGAPPGLTIDNDGVLHFAGADELTETTTYTTRIQAEDPEGEFAVWELTLTLNAAVPATRKYTPGSTGESEAGD